MRITVIDTVTSEHPNFVALKEFQKIKDSDKSYTTLSTGVLVAFVVEGPEGLELRTGRIQDETMIDHVRGFVILEEDGMRSDVKFYHLTAISES